MLRSISVLRIATWNVAFCRNLPMVLETTRALPARDLISLQELSIHQDRTDAAAIAAELGASWRYEQVTAQLVAGRPQANGILWDARRIELENLDTVDLPSPSGRMMRSLPRQRRNAVVADLRLGAWRIRVYAVHLDVFGIAHKHAQLARVLDDASGRASSDLVLIAGDMNTYGIAGRPRWAELRRLAAAANFDELTTGIGWTHRALGVRQKLDAVFAAPRALSHRAWRVPLPGSDHVPVLVDLELPTPAESPPDADVTASRRQP
jgi:endonuclease/exonuclease/phosphatase family metal-dependent hydrolase